MGKYKPLFILLDSDGVLEPTYNAGEIFMKGMKLATLLEFYQAQSKFRVFGKEDFGTVIVLRGDFPTDFKWYMITEEGTLTPFTGWKHEDQRICKALQRNWVED